MSENNKSKLPLKGIMKLIKQRRLYFKEGNSDKVYEVDLCELSTSEPDRYLVNFRYGRRGQKLREGTKTAEPCNLVKAQKVFDSIVVAKTNKGYSDSLEKSNKEETQVASTRPVNNETDAISGLLVTKLNNESKSKRRSRLIWRLGELGQKSNIPGIVSNLGKGDWVEDYSIVWALGRIADSEGLTYVKQLIKSGNGKVSRLAAEVSLLLVSSEERDSILVQEQEQFSEKIKQVIHSNQQANVMSQAIVDWLQEEKGAQNECLRLLYRQTLNNPALNKGLAKVLASIVFEPGCFAGIRHIYKMAELRLDSEIFGILSHRIETNKAYFYAEWGWYYDLKSGRNIDVKKELKKPDSKLAYSSKTRNYLRRRSWRSIRRLAELQDPNYVEMACGILLAVSDADAVDEKTSNVYGWNSDSRNYEIISSNHYGRYAGLLAFNHIIRGNSERYQLAKSRNAWLKNAEVSTSGRQESFPELWDKNPVALVKLLKHSRCQQVHIFALRILEEHSEFCSGLAAEDLLWLLQSAYDCTVEFAFGLVEQKLKSGVFDKKLVLGLAACSLPQAQSLAIEKLDANLEFWTKDNDVICELVVTGHEPVRSWLKQKLPELKFDRKQQEELAKQVISTCIQLDVLEEVQCEFILKFFELTLSESVGNLDILLIESLVMNEKYWLQLLGAGLLLFNNVTFKDIPAQLKDAISSSKHDRIRAIGIRLLGKQPIEDLVVQAKTIANLFYSGDQAERDAVRALIQEPCQLNKGFATELFDELINYAFRAESKEGQHTDIQKICVEIIENGDLHIDKNLLWRLLQAQSKAAQVIGGKVLSKTDAQAFTVSQWAVLARHAQKNVRDWSEAAYSNNLDSVKHSTRAALTILDSQWLETREFAFDYFRKNFSESEWNPDLIIYICDNNRDDVQAFGRELLQKFFKQEEGEAYLIKLSQHPSENVQLFASSFLQEYAANKPENILRLRGYFVTTLSLVNRGRICKNRIYSFLIREAEKDQSVAALVAELFTRQSITTVIRDKSFLVKAMLKLKGLYPGLDFPIASIGKPVWQKTREA